VIRSDSRGDRQKEHPCGPRILALGVRPNVELAQSAGAEIGTSGAIAVDAALQTSDPDIFAGGDCVKTANLVSKKKVFAPMGRLLISMAVSSEKPDRRPATFQGGTEHRNSEVIDLNVGKTGITEREAKAGI